MKLALLLGTAIPVLALGLASAVNLPTKLIYNASESAPIGFYWIDQEPISRGDYVYVRASERVRNLIIEREYLPPDVPLVKRVVGLTGDRICRAGVEVSVNGTVVETAKKRDGLGREMPGWHGCHIVTGRTVFLLQDHPWSFDGRYFGPVDRRLIIGRATPVLFSWRKQNPCWSSERRELERRGGRGSGGQDKRSWCNAALSPVCTSGWPAHGAAPHVQAFSAKALFGLRNCWCKDDCGVFGNRRCT